MKPKQPAGRPMTLGNMRYLGVRGLAVHYLNPQCRHQTVFSADDYPDEVPVPSFQASRQGMAMSKKTGGPIKGSSRQRRDRPMAVD